MSEEYKNIDFIINVLENFMKLNKKEQKQSIKILKKKKNEIQYKDNITVVIKTLEDFIKKNYKEQLAIIEDLKIFRMELTINE